MGVGPKSDKSTYRLRECDNGEGVGLVKKADADSIYGCSPSGSVGRRTHLVRDGRRVVLAPLGDERLLLLARRRELEVARLLRDDGALVHRLQVGRQLGAELAHLLRVEVAHLLGHVHRARHLLVVALLGALLGDAPGAADLSHGRRQFKGTLSQSLAVD